MLAARAEVIPSAGLLRRAISLMARYRELRMDLVDALLVAAAEEHGVDEILTLDARDFGAYRMEGRRPFRLLPSG